ncbi:MAG: type I DNA topoisomerase [Bacilli bacterium]|nr:type I DNA topoisomerase [Bacilli bacterium]
MKLVIVESPAKCTTIQKYLGEDYLVKASLGHIRDLATTGKGGLGVDVDNGFAPTYAINKEKIKTVYELKALAKQADEVILATDPDREGEAIAWHLANVLNLDPSTNKRWEFHEITRDSIKEAMSKPRTIDMNLVSSQETRRILDRIIGFKLSALLNSKIHSKSAGRVQSAALKLINDHDDEIKKFVPEEYWNILVKIAYKDKEFNLNYLGFEGKKTEITSKKDADQILEQIGKEVSVISTEKSYRVTESKEPFTTSTMQQEAFAKLKFKTKKTQYLAQGLYEGIEIAGEHVGLITYMRTDSTRLSPAFIGHATTYIKNTYGEEYLGHARQLQKVGHMQDAHEAIRPTADFRTPDSVRKYLSPDQYSLYKLIYNRTMASLMKPKKDEVTKVIFDANGHRFQLEFVRNIFKGYEVVLKDKSDEYHGVIPEFNAQDKFTILEKSGEQKFTQPPAPYTEAKLVKLMEEVGIGRPSTYVSTIETLKSRAYINNNGGVLTVTEQGDVTCAVLDKYFPEIVNSKYTAKMENQLDSIKDGNNSRLKILNSFYKPFIEELEVAKEKIWKTPNETTGEVCPRCGAPLIYKEGKNGRFIGCSNFPKCNYVKKEKKELVYTGETCPNCGKPMVERKDRRGNIFHACSGYPKCNYIEPTKSEPKELEHVKKCPKCGGYLVRKKGKYSSFLGCTNYPTCNYMERIVKKKKMKKA